MQEKIENLIKDALKNLGIEEVDFVVEHPEDLKNGDYSTNVAFACAKKLKINPKELAEKIVENLQTSARQDLEEIEIEKIKVAGAGFINFYLSRSFFSNSVKEILEKVENFGQNSLLGGKKIFIEHTQPNPFKEFHIGHLMNNTIGESVARIVKSCGADTKVATYHGDVGLHVAKAIWAITKKNIELNQAYAFGNKAYEEDDNATPKDGQAKKEILEINKKIYDKSDSEINKIYEDGKKVSLNHFEMLYKRFDSHFDFHFYESEAGEIGKNIVLENLGRIFEESEGAVIFKGENFEPKTHTRVFLNSEKLPTYEAKEVGLAEIKKNIFPYDQSITITGNEQDAFFDVVEVAIGEVFPELKGKLKHLSHGMLKLPGGKMSSRTGNIVTAETLIDQVKEKIKQKMTGRGYMSKAAFDIEKITEIVAVGALKYSILHQSTGGDIIFDFEKSLSFEGDSGPYLQYSAIRAKSVLAKAGSPKTFNLDIGCPSEVNGLEKILYRYPEIIFRAYEELQPHHIATYLTLLASSFNSFYAQTQIINAGDKHSAYYLALTKAFLTTMQNGLYLLGIKVPEKM